MTLDDIEALAREVHTRNASVKFGDPRYSCSIGSHELLRLLIAIKAFLPVVRSAEAWADSDEPNKEMPLRCEDRLFEDVATMRRALDGEKS